MLTSEHLDAAYDAGYMAGEDDTNPHIHPALRQSWEEGHREAFFNRIQDPTPFFARVSTRAFAGVGILALAIGLYNTLQ